jgi:hypothetical protein
MDYVNLGRTGLKVSRLWLGCMTYGSPAWRSLVLDDASSPKARLPPLSAKQPRPSLRGGRRPPSLGSGKGAAGKSQLTTQPRR